MICGKPREGIHALRFLDIAVVDMGVVVLAAVGWTAYTGPFSVDRLVSRFATLLAAGVCVHRALGLNTALNVALFGPV